MADMRDNANAGSGQGSNAHETNLRVSDKIAIEEAYGMLWLVVTDDPRVHEARKRLLTQLDKEGQKRGIQVAKHTFGAPTESESISTLPDEKPSEPIENKPEWIWYCESTSGVPVVTFGRWAKHPQQSRYKLAEVQPTEHDHSTPKGLVVPEGWQLVPKRLTNEMMTAACKGWFSTASMNAVYEFALEAAPSPQPREEPR